MRAVLLSLAFVATAHAGQTFSELAIQMRREALLGYSGPPVMSPAPQPLFSFGRSHYPWKLGITATCFWSGESAASGGGISNYKSAYDPLWAEHAPTHNPYYVALPVVDIDSGRTKAEASRWIPWFKSEWIRDGQSILKDHWVSLRHGNKVCYAQLEDAGPFHTDSWEYVFGNARPSPNRNNDAGIDVSPAVRDYLGISGMDTLDWRWCDVREVPRYGPWLTPVSTLALNNKRK